MPMTATAVAPKTNYTLAITAADGTTAKQSLGATAYNVRLVSSTDMFVQFKVGSSPTASTSTDMFLPAYTPEYFNISHDIADVVYVTGIVASGTGTLYASVMG